jgi:hypothetical protein
LTIDSRRSPNRRDDEAGLQPSLAAGAAGYADLAPATSRRPVSGEIETPGEPNSGRRPAIQRTGEVAAKAVVTWLRMRSRKDWSIVRRAIADGYVLVTNNTTDF